MDEAIGMGKETEAEAPPKKNRWGIWDVLCVGPIIANSIYYYAGIPLTPLLIGTHPLLLSLLRGTIASMVTTGAFARVGMAPLWLALLAPIPISMMTDPFFYWAGRRYGRRFTDYLASNDPRWRKRTARGERFVAKYGFWTVLLAPILPVPSPLFYMAAGDAGMAFWLFILADIIGTLIYISLIVGAGWFIGQPAVTVAQTVSSYALYVIIVMVVCILAYSFYSGWRNYRADQGKA